MEPFEPSRAEPDRPFFFVEINGNLGGTFELGCECGNQFATEKEATEYALSEFEKYGCETAIYHAIPVKVIRRSPKIIKTAPKGERT